MIENPTGPWRYGLHCFSGCRAAGILAAAGLAWDDLLRDPQAPRRAPSPPLPVPAPPRALDPANPLDLEAWSETWRATVAAERRRVEKLAPHWDTWPRADAIKAQRREIARLRAELSARGDTESTWRGLAACASWEMAVSADEAQLDADVSQLWQTRGTR